MADRSPGDRVPSWALFSREERGGRRVDPPSFLNGRPRQAPWCEHMTGRVGAALSILLFADVCFPAFFGAPFSRGPMCT